MRGSVTVNDGTLISYDDRGVGRPIVLIHGWSFSSDFFVLNRDVLARRHRVISIDLRGHGDSGRPGHGYRVPRLAKDLHDVVTTLDLNNVSVLGWSIGCAVIWSYLELFGNERLAQAVFVEQLPSQYRRPDWEWAHNVIWDDASLASFQQQVLLDPTFDEGQLDTILRNAPSPDLRDLLVAAMAKCPARVRNPLMADHTRYDWRDFLPHITLPSLVLVARHDADFPWQGPAVVGELIPDSETIFFEDSSHALFLDEPEKFNSVVSDFLDRLN